MASGDRWDKKLNSLRETYPRIDNIDWNRILHSEPDVFHGMITGIVRPEKAKKSQISTREGTQKIAQLNQVDYSELEFSEAFSILCSNLSIRKTGAKLNISPSMVYSLKNGKTIPSFEMIEHISRTFGKDPSFFLEYRIAKVLAAIDNFLTQNPETATVWFKKVSDRSGLKV